mmetsp:Transcript_30974/g.82512  ORF Transcript_30974/g.82512 Transcript_30974/m.82512 type:complete len:118 (-) Transcript_30974:1149-1502(-)
MGSSAFSTSAVELQAHTLSVPVVQTTKKLDEAHTQLAQDATGGTSKPVTAPRQRPSSVELTSNLCGEEVQKHWLYERMGHQFRRRRSCPVQHTCDRAEKEIVVGSAGRVNENRFKAP